MNTGWFKDLFIDEAKSALDYHGTLGGSGGNSSGSGGNSGDEEWFNDGNTHIWISLPEGKTSPMLGVCVDGTVTVDWGDGSEPYVLTGTSKLTQKYTPTHEYGKKGNYVITLTVDGEMVISGYNGITGGTHLLRYSTNGDCRNAMYANAIQKAEIGNGTIIGGNAFIYCYGLTDVLIHDGVTSIGNTAFQYCRNLKSIVIPDSVVTIGNYAFDSCYKLATVTLPKAVDTIGEYVFQHCYSLTTIKMPDTVTSMGAAIFHSCYMLSDVTIPYGPTKLHSTFTKCHSLKHSIIPNSVTTVGHYSFSECYSMECLDFSNYESVPTLESSTPFNTSYPRYEILVPAALYDEWIAATNWTKYASYIKAV